MVTGEEPVDEPEPDTIAAAAGGDLAAFEALMQAYQVPVWRFLRHLLGDDSLAEDVTQETFLRVHQRLGTFTYRSKFSTWLLQVARHAGVDALRAQERRNRLAERVRPAGPAAGADSGTEITAALTSLSSKLREAVLVVEIFGLTYREAATVIGVPEGTVKSRVAQDRHQLLAWLAAGEQANEV
jgi:RNA polymerase sigma-70 factor, ECF subfamily